MNASSVRDRWGSRYFKTVPTDAADSLPMRAEDRQILTEIGLPLRPKKALHLCLRWENVDIRHQPDQVRLLVDTDLERGPHFPKTGHSVLDSRIDLSQLVVLGDAPNDFEGGSFFLNRFVCVDGNHGDIYWVYPELQDDCTGCVWFNTSLDRYLSSLLAYKEFRGEWKALLKEVDPEKHRKQYEQRAKPIHEAFLSRLEQIDPITFKDGFWQCHAWNEAILMEIG